MDKRRVRQIFAHAIQTGDNDTAALIIATTALARLHELRSRPTQQRADALKTEVLHELAHARQRA